MSLEHVEHVGTSQLGSVIKGQVDYLLAVDEMGPIAQSLVQVVAEAWGTGEPVRLQVNTPIEPGAVPPVCKISV